MSFLFYKLTEAITAMMTFDLYSPSSDISWDSANLPEK